MTILKYLMKRYNINLYSTATNDNPLFAIVDYNEDNSDKYDIMSHLKVEFEYVEETNVVRDLKNNLIESEPEKDHIITKGILFRKKSDF